MLRGRAGGNIGDLVVLNGEVFKALDGGIGDTVAAPSTVVAFFLAEGQQSRDVVHTVFSFLVGVFLNGVTEFVHLPTKVLKVVCHNDTPLPMN